MMVKDLIYLLQTRAKPDDEVWFYFLSRSETGGVEQHYIPTFHCSFDTVWREPEGDEHVIEPEDPTALDWDCVIRLPHEIMQRVVDKIRGKSDPGAEPPSPPEPQS